MMWCSSHRNFAASALISLLIDTYHTHRTGRTAKVRTNYHRNKAVRILIPATLLRGQLHYCRYS